MANLINIKINNTPIQVEAGTTILEAAKSAGVKIPTLCYLKNVNNSGACRVCVVEVKGGRGLVSSCVYPVFEGMEVFTHSKKAIEGRRQNVELLLSNHSKDCLSCVRNQRCELQTLTDELGIRNTRYSGEKTPHTIDLLSPGIGRDTSKCVLCGRCVETCKKSQGLGILGYMNRGFDTKVGPTNDRNFVDVNCMQCGQCVINCPVGALHERESIDMVLDALNDPSKHVIVQTAPAIRASLGEEFGLPIGTRVTGQMAAALKRMGFERVYDTNYGADLTIMEEGGEFIHRLKNGGKLPMITSCSPGWVRYVEFEYPDILENVSSCKSPHMMLGAVIKSYYAETHGYDKKDMYVVSVMPCTSKKTEIIKPENITDGIQDVDAVITTRELAKMIRLYGIDFNSLPNEGFDQDLFGEYSGAGAIFGATGGVMEAALRTVKDLLEGKSFDDVDYEVVRGMQGVKEATLNIAGIDVNICVASGMKNAKPILEEVRKGTSKYHFIEIMGCPGGCINGGGQSIVSSVVKNDDVDYRALRASVLYEEDRLLPKRKSHDNEQIQSLYKNYLGEPNSHKAHELLHTTYNKKDRFKKLENE